MRPRRWQLAAAGLMLLLAAPPLELVSHVAYYAVWYAGAVLAGAWLLLDITRRPRA